MNQQGIRLVRFLKYELGLSSRSIALGLRRQRQSHGPLPMVLYQLGFIDLVQLDYLYEWTWSS
ncbi:DUF2949 domain-containing protein [Anthocerotibacter panamensis]|uniref:DUF2949 domain-containing protein n=1 Tax=Anthocerotibacter panamensis TaxID=2857077 RepID=UPI001C408C74|nr:DUF2949 domain-containing protein [Anthocerotibacter panamensis]